MSTKHPIISVTGSSGAGTTSVRNTFEQIFRRDGVKAAFIQGAAFHRYDRAGMKQAVAKAASEGNVTSGKADQVALARALLDNPRWVWHAAEKLGASIAFPPQYERASAKLWPGAAIARPV